MKARTLRQATFALMAFAGAMPAVHAQKDPSIETCVQYAEADAELEKAKADAEAAAEALAEALDDPIDEDLESAANSAKWKLIIAKSSRFFAHFRIYEESGGVRSKVPEVSSKLLHHQRNRCTQLYGVP